jgi:hypothetical protein
MVVVQLKLLIFDNAFHRISSRKIWSKRTRNSKGQ